MSTEEKNPPEDKKPRTGDFRFNTEKNMTEIAIGGSWVPTATSTTASSITTNTTTTGATGPWVSPSTGGGLTFGPMTTGPGIMVVPEEKKKEPRKIVEFPKRVTRKVVIGFIEDDDSIVWGAKLKLLDFHIDFDNMDGEGRITLVADIEDVGDDDPK